LSYFKQIKFIIGNDFKFIPILSLLFILVSCLEVIGLALIYPFISIITGGNSGTFSNEKLDFLFEYLNFDNYFLSILFFLVFFSKAIGLLVVNKKIFKFCYNKGAKIKIEILDRIQKLEYSNYIKKESSEYLHSIQVLVTDFSQSVLVSFLRIISESLLILFILLYLLYINYVALFILIVIVVFVSLIYDISCRKKLKEFGLLTNNSQTKLIESTNYSIIGFREIKILGVENYFKNRFIKYSNEYSASYANYQLLGTIPKSLLEISLVSFILILLNYSIFTETHLNSAISFICVLAVASIRLLPSINILIKGFTQLRFNRNSTSRLYKILTDGIELPSSNELTNELNASDFESIEFKDVSFSYNNSNQVLQNLSFKFNSSDFIGIVGETGSGKTTLINIMLGLLVPTSGKVIINGNAKHNPLRALRDQVSYIPQEPFITNGTIKANIALGINEDLVDSKKIWSLLKILKLDKHINDLPNGINTTMGERGINFSGGQRQRICIARALYHNRKLLILDESTSALDIHTENEIISELNELRQSMTIVMISHRFNTLKYCNHIYKIDKGRLSIQNTQSLCLS
jgi:ATP-binding cassette, subfamily B, bacterial PglK